MANDPPGVVVRTLAERLRYWANYVRDNPAHRVAEIELSGHAMRAADELDKLPKTADGVPAIPGDVVYNADGDALLLTCNPEPVDGGCDPALHSYAVGYCYSSEAAALAHQNPQETG